MGNYGWVQNTSNLSTIRDTLSLVDRDGIRHLDLREKIKKFRESHNNLPKRWTWDARCRIKAIHALGFVKLNRHIQGYELTKLGIELLKTKKASEDIGPQRKLSNEEIEVFKKGLLTNPPVIRVLSLLNDDRKGENRGLSKYDVGEKLGFAGDVGFTHIDPYWVANNNYSFGDKEGDSDKWARTILSWLTHVNWVYSDSSQIINNKSLKLFRVKPEIENILRYDAARITRNVPMEMLCSNHHAFPKLVQNRRHIILEGLKNEPLTMGDLNEILKAMSINTDETIIKFEIINLKSAGFRIVESGGYYKLLDKILLDGMTQRLNSEENGEEKENVLERKIEEYVVKFDKTIPPKYVDHLIRFGFDGTKHNEFESIVFEYFRFLGFNTTYYGQGKGRVTDVVARYIDQQVYMNSYGIIIDAKASTQKYSFPVGDKRKMTEYIFKHGGELMHEKIPNHSFAFISSEFSSNIKSHLKEIADKTKVNGTAARVENLLELGNKLKKGKIAIADLHSLFTTNELFKI